MRLHRSPDGQMAAPVIWRQASAALRMRRCTRSCRSSCTPARAARRLRRRLGTVRWRNWPPRASSGTQTRQRVAPSRQRVMQPARSAFPWHVLSAVGARPLVGTHGVDMVAATRTGDEKPVLIRALVVLSERRPVGHRATYGRRTVRSARRARRRSAPVAGSGPARGHVRCPGRPRAAREAPPARRPRACDDRVRWSRREQPRPRRCCP